MNCAISNKVPDEAVVCRKTGFLFEKSLIMRHLEESPNCPVTGVEMTSEDLVAVSAPRTPKAQPAAAQSIPNLITTLQSEWDNLMIQNFTMKKTIDGLRQELAHALYQHDSACRVIERMVKEREAGGPRPARAPEEEPEEAAEPAASNQMPEDVRNRILHLSSTDLQKNRRANTKSAEANATKADKIRSYGQTKSYKIHSASQTGVTSLAFSEDNSRVYSGGVDGKVMVYDREKDARTQTYEGHSGMVRRVVSGKRQGEPVCYSCSDDETIRVWGNQERELAQMGAGSGVMGLSLHVTNDYLLSATNDSKLIFWDVNDCREICHFDATLSEDHKLSSGFTCCDIHPDGVIFAAGANNNENNFMALDVKSMDVVAKFPGHTGVATSVAFSQNGFSMATAATDGKVKIWDLRRMNNIKTITIGETDNVNSVRFDDSGLYLAVASDRVRVLDVKNDWKPLMDQEGHTAPVTDLAWGADAKMLATSSLDKTVRFWGSS